MLGLLEREGIIWTALNFSRRYSSLKNERASPAPVCQTEIAFVLHHGSLEEIMLAAQKPSKKDFLLLNTRG